MKMNIDYIKFLEQKASALDPLDKIRKNAIEKVTDCSEQFLSGLDTSPVFNPSETEGSGLFDSPITEEGKELDDVLQLFDEHILQPGLNPTSPRHFGYIPGSGLFYSALGDYLAAVSNRYAGIYAASPGAVRCEHLLIKWIAKVLGYPDTMAGDLTSGGSIATLSAIVSARDAIGIKAKHYDSSVIYMTRHTHHCVEKAIRIAGLNECIIRFVDIDEKLRMKADALHDCITSDKQKGLHPWLLIATAGTTNTGSVDPLKDLSIIAKVHKLWFHVDGAYGAAFALCDSGKKVLDGIDLSDSLVMDPHKGLFLPFGTGAVLIRDGIKLHGPHRYEADYMQDESALAHLEMISPAELSPELTRHFRGLRLWLPLQLCGVAPFRAALEEKILLAQYFYHEISKIPGIETGPFPDLSIVIFRYLPLKGDPDTFNESLVHVIQEDGRVFLSSTIVNDAFVLRMAVLSFRSHLNEIDQVIEIIKEKIKFLEKG
ncbi:MAG: aminotransferase class V-fold PLP-dependent enzyme [Desulfobacteraceae bacterium]|nr:aminotransferase class V-fold PLP-dependent enzyme [Desulfobacteraceae bacterium]